MPEIIVGDERWHYLRNRSGDSACLVLVHGSGGSHRHWPAEIARLEGMDVIVPDLPGHGTSTGRSRNRVEDYASGRSATDPRLLLRARFHPQWGYPERYHRVQWGASPMDVYWQVTHFDPTATNVVDSPAP